MQADPHGAWTWSDAWVLAATPQDPSGCSLSDLIRTADGINHAIVTRDELADGLGALVAAGLVDVQGDRIYATPAGCAIKNYWRRGLFGWRKSLLPQLRKIPRPAQRLEISQSDYDAAVAAHLGRRSR